MTTNTYGFGYSIGRKKWSAMTLVIAATVPLLVALAESPGSAGDLLTFEFTGTVTHVDPELSAAFTTGQAMSGEYTFDSTAPDTAPSPSIGLYPIESFTFDIGGYRGATVGSIYVRDGQSGDDSDIYRVQNNRGVEPIDADPVGGLIPAEASFQLTDMTGAAFDSDALPLVPPDLDDFAYLRQFRLTFTGSGGGPPFYSVRGIVSSFTISTCTLDLALSFDGGTLNMDFLLSSSVPVIWDTWLISESTPVWLPGWSVPLPSFPTTTYSVPIDDFPDLGLVGVLTYFYGPGGIICWDFDVVDTGGG